MNCIIVDDDDMVRIDLEHKIHGKSMLQLVGSFSSAMDAFEFMSTAKVDLIFLDILMPGMSGIQFLKNLSSHRPQIILITSESQFAVEAFEYEVTDFMVKPISEDRFLKAVMRAMNNRKSSNVITENSNFIFVKTNGNFERIELSQILYIEALADYVTIHTTESKFIAHLTMKAIEDSLVPSSFARVHNSFIVNIERISRVEDSMVVIEKKLIPISRSRFKPLMQRLNLLS